MIGNGRFSVREKLAGLGLVSKQKPEERLHSILKQMHHPQQFKVITNHSLYDLTIGAVLDEIENEAEAAMASSVSVDEKMALIERKQTVKLFRTKMDDQIKKYQRLLAEYEMIKEKLKTKKTAKEARQ